MLPPVKFITFLIVYVTVLNVGSYASKQEELKDHECETCANFFQRNHFQNEVLNERIRRSSYNVKRRLSGALLNSDCAYIGTVGVGETFDFLTRNSLPDPPAIFGPVPIRERKFMLSIMCPEDTQVEVDLNAMFSSGQKFKNKYNHTWNTLPYNFTAPTSSQHRFYIRNLGGSKSNKKIMFKFQEIDNEYCSEKKTWETEQKTRAKDPFAEGLNKYLSMVDMYDALNGITKLLASLVPIPGLGGAVDLFWRYMKPSTWDKMISEVLVHIKNDTIAQNLMASKHRLESVKLSIENLKKIAESNPSETDYYSHFTSVYDKLLTTHVHFEFDDLDTSIATLPIVTVTMSLIMQFFALILTDPTYKMNAERTSRIEDARSTVLENINSRILHIYEQHMTNAFNHCNEENRYRSSHIYIYDCIVDAHNLLALQGLKFLSAWNKLAHFPSNDHRTVHIPIYSHYFGRPTNDLVRDVYLSNMTSLLTPPVYDLTGCYGTSPNPTCFLRKRVTLVSILFLDKNKPDQISGVQVRHDKEVPFDKRSGSMTTYIRGVKYIDVPEGVYIEKIRAGVNDRIRFLEFFMSDESKYSYGTGYDDKEKTIPETIFELPEHYIADILVKSDDAYNFRSSSVAYGISVSYLPKPLSNY